MAPPIDDHPTDTRPGAVRDGKTGPDDAARRPDARMSVRETELKRHRGGPTLWIVLAAVVAILLALYLFSGAFSSTSGVETDVDVAPGVAVDGAVVDAPAILPDTATTVPDVTVAPVDGVVVPAN